MKQDKWLTEIKNELEQSTDTLDASVQSRLYAARRRALASYKGSQEWSYRRWPIWTSAVAATAVLSLSVLFWQQSGNQAVLPELAAGDMELITNSEEFALLDELEFYQWLEESEQDAG